MEQPAPTWARISYTGFSIAAEDTEIHPPHVEFKLVETGLLQT